LQEHLALRLSRTQAKTTLEIVGFEQAKHDKDEGQYGKADHAVQPIEKALCQADQPGQIEMLFKRTNDCDAMALQPVRPVRVYLLKPAGIVEQPLRQFAESPDDGGSNDYDHCKREQQCDQHRRQLRNPPLQSHLNGQDQRENEQ